jgi:predicted signal transduction protein with EAL and GGDEF domain
MASANTGRRSCRKFSNACRCRPSFATSRCRCASDEDRHFWLLSGKPVFDNAGAFTGYHGAGADVTDKRVADERIIHLARYDAVTDLPNRASFQEGSITR